MGQPLSRPKEKIKFLLLEGISDTAVNTLTSAGYTSVERLPKALEGDALREALKGVSIVGIRSRTRLNAKALDGMRSLIAIGCFSVGTNQVDLDAARHMGIPVFNAPFSNTRSVAELTIAEIIMLYRRVFPNRWAHMRAAGKRRRRAPTRYAARRSASSATAISAASSRCWPRRWACASSSTTAPTSCAMATPSPWTRWTELLAASDVVSLHVPETPETKGMIGEAQFRAMKPGAYFINNARGTVYDVEALARALKDKHLAGAAVDVFPVEPKSNADRFVSPLQGLDNVILTPHVGGSTLEAQERIGSEVARKLVEYSDVGSTQGAVNFPQVQLPPRPAGTRFIQVHRNLPGELGRLNEVFARHSVNIGAQYLQTDGEIGYVVLDADGSVDDASAVLAEIRALPGTIRARLLYRRTT